MAESGFWRFSIRFYDDEAAQRACLSLQDDYGADVNVALYLLYRASSGDCLSAEVIESLDSGIARWRQIIVRPLREIRRTLKEDPFLSDGTGQELFRNKIKKIELNAEKLQQLELETLAPAHSGTACPEEAARANLEAYGHVLGRLLPEELIEAFLKRLAVLLRYSQCGGSRT